MPPRHESLNIQKSARQPCGGGRFVVNHRALQPRERLVLMQHLLYQSATTKTI